MIGYLKGNLLKKSNRQFLIDVNGIGYRVWVPLGIFEKFHTDIEIIIFIHTSVREDDISLFGFETEEELALFELLLTVTRVGPKLALDLMNMPLAKLKQAIAKKDITLIASLHGVGRKTAERVILELRDKIPFHSTDTAHDNGKNESLHEEVMHALIKLGYERRHIARILQELPEEITREEDIIKYFLKYV